MLIGRDRTFEFSCEILMRDCEYREVSLETSESSTILRMALAEMVIELSMRSHSSVFLNAGALRFTEQLDPSEEIEIADSLDVEDSSAKSDSSYDLLLIDETLSNSTVFSLLDSEHVPFGSTVKRWSPNGSVLSFSLNSSAVGSVRCFLTTNWSIACPNSGCFLGLFLAK